MILENGVEINGFGFELFKLNYNETNETIKEEIIRYIVYM